jgi:hypothetical protein
MKFLAFLLSLFFCSQALATGPLEHQWWMDTFGVEISLQAPFDSLNELIVAPDSACKPQTQSLLSDIRAYAETASKRQARKAKKKADLILASVQSAQNGPCAQDILNTYLLGSYFISQKDLIHTSVNWLTGNGPSNMTYDLFASRISLSLRNVLIVAKLIHDGQVEFLTSSERKLLGAAWLSPEIFGSYDCGSRVISIDPSLRPFDLGAAFQHELDHLTRDQYFGSDLITKYYSHTGRAEDIDWEAFLTADESLASVEAAVTQRFQAVDGPSGGVWTVHPAFGIFGSNHQVLQGLYEASGDFTFRNSHGPMEKVFQAGDNNNPVLDLTHQLGDMNHDPSMFMGIFDVVHGVYFSETALDQDAKSFLKPYLPIQIASLERFQWNGPDLFSVNLFSELRTTVQNDAVEPVSLIYINIKNLVNSLRNESSACSLYDDAIDAGRVKGYRGLEFGTKNVDDSSPGERGSRPGERGSRPGERGSRPGERGSRPGERGSRPGERGSRPGERGSRPLLTVRPCLSMKGEL